MNVIYFFPYPLLLGMVTLVVLMIRQRHRGWLYLFVMALFSAYLMYAVSLVAFPVVISEDWPNNLSLEGVRSNLNHTVNLIPFNYGDMFFHLSDGSISPNIVLREIGGNILLTLPLGFGINLFRMIKRHHILGWAIATGLILEGTQLFIILLIGPSTHSVDVNDVPLNASGVLVGYGFYLSMIRVMGLFHRKQVLG